MVLNLFIFILWLSSQEPNMFLLYFALCTLFLCEWSHVDRAAWMKGFSQCRKRSHWRLIPSSSNCKLQNHKTTLNLFLCTYKLHKFVRLLFRYLRVEHISQTIHRMDFLLGTSILNCSGKCSAAIWVCSVTVTIEWRRQCSVTVRGGRGRVPSVWGHNISGWQLGQNHIQIILNICFWHRHRGTDLWSRWSPSWQQHL